MNLQKNAKLKLNYKLLLIATFISNVGNGVHTLAVSKLLYDKTGSASSFALVIIIENLVAFVLPFIVGAIVDRIRIVKLAVICDVSRGILVLLSFVVVSFNQGINNLMILLIGINIMNCFNKSNSFRLIYKIANDEESMLKINTMYNTAFQIGQVSGIALAAPILFYFSAKYLFLVNGLSFLFSAYIISRLKISSETIYEGKKINIKLLIHDWKNTRKEIQHNKRLLGCIVFSNIDLICINLVNIMIVPIVSNCFKGKDYLISLFDGSFAIGSIICVFCVKYLQNKLGTRLTKIVGILVEGFTFFGFYLAIQVNSLWLLVIMMLILGVANTFSVIIYLTLLQKESKVQIKGKIVSVKSFILSVSSVFIISNVSKIYDVSIEKGIILSGLIILFLCILVICYELIFHEKKELQESDS